MSSEARSDAEKGTGDLVGAWGLDRKASHPKERSERTKVRGKRDGTVGIGWGWLLGRPLTDFGRRRPSLQRRGLG